ncbi:Ig domain-containing protein [Porticoccaceae bacterium]|nr:Ig domain-containing protein [Porticoccaceae bacterium]
MSSILKVDTIQDQNGNLIISKDSGGGGFLSPYASSSTPITYTVTVASKTAAHPYNGVGSSNGYFINGIESPIIEIKGNDTSKPYHYKFDQSDASNSGHPLLFYNNASKTTAFTTGVTTNGTPGQAGAYTMIAVDSDTPNILYYQCSSHANMGNHTFLTSPTVNTGFFLKLPTTDGTADQVLKTDGSGTLSFGSSVTFPTIGSISPSAIENTQTAVTITGTNFQSIPTVDAINASTGAIITADSVAFTNATTIVATFTISVDGTYYLRAENNDGLAVRSTNALLTVSDAPAWTTAAGSLGTVAATGSVNFTVAATNATSFAKTSGSFPGGVSINASTGVISGTESGSSATTTYTFTIRATDAEAQTADRQFTITISHGASGGAQFN